MASSQAYSASTNAPGKLANVRLYIQLLAYIAECSHECFFIFVLSSLHACKNDESPESMAQWAICDVYAKVKEVTGIYTALLS